MRRTQLPPRAASIAIAAASTLLALSVPAAASAVPARPFSVTVRPEGPTVDALVVPRTRTVKWDAFLNGRKITPVFRYTPPGGRRIVLAADDGLRFGRNRLTIVAHYPNRRRTIVRTFSLSRNRPLASGGADKLTLGTPTVLLSGRGSRAGHGGRLSYRWRITRRPAGSRARLIGARGPQPRLVTDRPGTYRMRLEVRERSRRGARAAALGSALRADDVQISQYAADAKRGVFVGTTPASPGAFQPGGFTISGGPFSGTYRTAGNPSGQVATMFFDRATMEPLPLSHPSIFWTSADLPGAKVLLGALISATNDASALGHTVGVLSFGAGYGTMDPTFASIFTDFLQVPGGSDRFVSGATGPFSVYSTASSGGVGVAGTSWFSTEEFPQMRFGGTLALDNTGQFGFVPNDVPALSDTSIRYATSPSGITVNGNTIPAGPLGGVRNGGYQVRVIDARALSDVSDPAITPGSTFYTNENDNNSSVAAAYALHDYLQRQVFAAGAPPRLVFIQAVGAAIKANPSQTLDAAMWNIALQIRALGGSAEAFKYNGDALSGPAYALVGRNFTADGPVGGTDASPAEVTTVAPQSPKPRAALSGVLERDRRWHFVVSSDAHGDQLTGSNGDASLMLRDAAQAINPSTLQPTPFPRQNDPAFLAILDYTARTPVYGYNDTNTASLADSLCYPLPNAPAGSGRMSLIDIRALYCGGSKSQGSWKGNATALLSEVSAGTTPPPPGVSKTDYATILTSLANEGALVDNLNTVIDTLTTPFGTQQVNAKVDLGDAVALIDQTVADARHEQQEQFEQAAATFSKESKLFLLGDLFDVGEAVGDLLSAETLAPILGLAGATSSIAAEFTHEPDGSPALGPFVSGETISTVRGDLESSYRAYGSALQSLRDLIVSDARRLNATAGLSTTGDDVMKLQQALAVSGGRYIWRTLLQSLFRPTKLVSTAFNPSPLDARNYKCPKADGPPFESDYQASVFFWRPWGNQGTFPNKPLFVSNVITGRNNLAPPEGVYSALATSYGTETAYVLSSGGTGYPFQSYTDPKAFPPYDVSAFTNIINNPPQNLPAGVFAPLFATPTQDTLNGATLGDAASPQGITKQLFFPQLIRAADQSGVLNTLTCVQPDIGLYSPNWTDPNSGAITP